MNDIDDSLKQEAVVTGGHAPITNQPQKRTQAESENFFEEGYIDEVEDNAGEEDFGGNDLRSRIDSAGISRSAVEIEPVSEAYTASYSDRISEVVIGSDDRVRINNTKRFPYRAICHLSIRARNGQRFLGTGWFVNPRTLITAGHCVYLHRAGGWPASIIISPGRNGNSRPYGSCVARSFRTVRGWVRARNRNYDYGAIILPRNCSFVRRNLGHFDVMVANERMLRRQFINIAGYPGDKPAGTQWYHGRRITGLTGQRIVYDADTTGGQSGSAVHIVQRYRGRPARRVAIGIHTTGKITGNSGVRINQQVLSNIQRWKREGA